MNYKKLSSHGLINIPVAMRREMGIQGGDPMEVSMKDGTVVVAPYLPRCIFCGEKEDVKPFEGKHICIACARKAVDVMKGEN